MYCIPRGRVVVLSLALALTTSLASNVSATAADVELAGVRLAQELPAGNHSLLLNGAGVRSKFVIDVYVAALYVTTRSHDANTLINSTEPRRIRLQLLREVDSKTLDDALREGLHNNIPKEELISLQEPSSRFSALMAQLGNIKKGDVIDLDFNATGVTVSHNGQLRDHIDNPAFGHALLRVWLGNHPVQSSLKKALLGK